MFSPQQLYRTSNQNQKQAEEIKTLHAALRPVVLDQQAPPRTKAGRRRPLVRQGVPYPEYETRSFLSSCKSFFLFFSGFFSGFFYGIIFVFFCEYFLNFSRIFIIRGKHQYTIPTIFFSLKLVPSNKIKTPL